MVKLASSPRNGGENSAIAIYGRGKIVCFEMPWEKKKTIQNRNDVLFQILTSKLNSKLPSNENLTTVTISYCLKIKLRLNL